MRFFSRLFPRSARPRPTFRPQLEAFEDRCVPAVIAASIPLQGVVRFTDGQPQLLTSGAPRLVSADAQGDVLADFLDEDLGLWRYEDRTGWQQLSPYSPISIDIRNGKVAAYFLGAGLWEYQDGTGWQQLIGPSATDVFVAVKIDDAGGVLTNSSGSMWYHPDGGPWQGVIGLDTQTFDIAGDGQMVFNFSGYGVWRYHLGGNWEQQTPVDMNFVKVNAAGAVAVALVGDTLAPGGVFVRGAGALSWSLLTNNGTCGALGLGGDGSVAANLYHPASLWYWSSAGVLSQLSTEGAFDMSYQD
jgi:hypothetical protein